MMIRILGPLTILVCFLGLAAADDKKDLSDMQGIWVPKSAELGGKALPADFNKMTMTIKDDIYKVVIGEMSDIGKIKIDSSKTPKSMTITGTEGPNKDKSLPAIYQIKGDTFTICYNLGGKEAPTEFKTQEGTTMLLIEYTRKK